MTAEFVPAGAGGHPLDATPVAAPVLIEGTGPVQHEVTAVEAVSRSLATLARSVADDFDVNHTVSCHDDNVAVCGADVSDAIWLDTDENSCAVCDDLEAVEDALPEPIECTCPCCCSVPTEADISP